MEPQKAALRRLNFVLSETAYEELQTLSAKSHRSMTELVRLGIGLMRIADEAKRHQQKLMVVDADNKAVKEIVVPS